MIFGASNGIYNGQKAVFAMQQLGLVLRPPRYQCIKCFRPQPLEQLHADDTGLRCINPDDCKRLGALRRRIIASQAAQRRAKFRLLPGGK